MSWVEDHLRKGYEDRIIKSLVETGQADIKGIASLTFTGDALDVEVADSFLKRVQSEAAAHAHLKYAKRDG